MKYPYLLHARGVRHQPIFRGLKGDPFVLDLSCGNPLLDVVDVRDQRAFQQLLDRQMAPRYSWGFAGYLENRSSLLRDCPQMVEEGRFFHLGLDILVPLGSALHAPLAAVVSGTGYEEGEGNFGGYVLLCHREPGAEPFYSLYGHLCPESLPDDGRLLQAGQPFARIGDFHENGNWFYHTHLQILTEEALRRGYLSKGYAAEADLGVMNALCPSPVPLFKRG
ncbi:MAG: hypothetical protein LJE65_00745 [Desulfobacteraceae bacterium]|nr:hypothetical protein [Desulfobacteraceae bacterium]